MTYASRSQAIIEGDMAGAQAGAEALSTEEQCSSVHVYLSYTSQALEGIARSGTN